MHLLESFHEIDNKREGMSVVFCRRYLRLCGKYIIERILLSYFMSLQIVRLRKLREYIYIYILISFRSSAHAMMWLCMHHVAKIRFGLVRQLPHSARSLGVFTDIMMQECHFFDDLYSPRLQLHFTSAI